MIPSFIKEAANSLNITVLINLHDKQPVLKTYKSPILLFSITKIEYLTFLKNFHFECRYLLPKDITNNALLDHFNKFVNELKIRSKNENLNLKLDFFNLKISGEIYGKTS